jgi:hypothetical protein
MLFKQELVITKSALTHIKKSAPMLTKIDILGTSQHGEWSKLLKKAQPKIHFC